MGVRPAWARTDGMKAHRLDINLTHLDLKDDHEPTARASPRGSVRRKPEWKRCEATDRNRIQGRGMRGEPAPRGKAHGYAAYGQCGACAPTVRVLIWGDLHRLRCVLSDDGSGSDPTGIPRSKRCGVLPAACDEQAALILNTHSATRGNACRDGAEVMQNRSGKGSFRGIAG